MSRHSRARALPRGMTLIEIMVVLAIIAVLAAATVVGTGGMANNRVRAEALHISGAMRLVYGRSAINGIRYQFVIDLDENAYWVECSAENILVAPEGEEEEVDDRDDEADPFGLGAQAPTMDDCTEDLLERHTLRDGVRFGRVLTTHQSEPAEDGQVTIAFFPNGFVERSIVWITDEDDQAYTTLTIDPMSGRVRAVAGDMEVPEDFFAVEED